VVPGAGRGRAFSSPQPRVRVKDRQLRQWYRTLDQLLVQQKQIEKELFLRLRNLFSLNVDLVFYDLTSTYFEGNGPVGLALHGHSRDGKPRNRQVLVGMVMIEMAHCPSRFPWQLTRCHDRGESAAGPAIAIRSAAGGFCG
jgi:hypothetical protein